MNAPDSRPRLAPASAGRLTSSVSKPGLLILLLFIAFFGFGSMVSTTYAAPNAPQDDYTFSMVNRSFDGKWFWRDDDGTWTIVLKPAGENAWEVSCWFPASPSPGIDTPIYRGEATGALDGGPFEGWVADPGGTRYVIRGTIEDGEFSGTHYIVEDDEEVENGTLTFG